MGLLDKLYPRTVRREDYSKLIVDEFRRHGITATASADDPFELRLDDGSLVFLDNAYSIYLKTSNAERPEKISFFVSAQLPRDRDLTRERLGDLFPIVRSDAYYSLTELLNRSNGKFDGAAIAFQPLAPGLSVGLAIDSEKSMTIVRDNDLAAIDLSFSDALSLAIGNLEASWDHKLKEHAPGLFIGDWEDGYASSRILLPQVWSNLPVKGIPLLHLPSRDKFFVFGSSDAYAMKLALTLGAEELEGAYPLAADVFVQREGKWLSAVPAGENKSIQDRMVQKRLALDYSQQKELLEKIHQQQRIDVFVASYKLYETADPPAQFSLSVWSKGIPTLLPLTDQVTLLIDADSQDAIRVMLQDLRRICAKLMPRVKNLRPIRFHVEDFPDEAQLAQLRACAVPSN